MIFQFGNIHIKVNSAEIKEFTLVHNITVLLDETSVSDDDNFS